MALAPRVGQVGPALTGGRAVPSPVATPVTASPSPVPSPVATPVPAAPSPVAVTAADSVDMPGQQVIVRIERVNGGTQVHLGGSIQGLEALIGICQQLILKAEPGSWVGLQRAEALTDFSDADLVVYLAPQDDADAQAPAEPG